MKLCGKTGKIIYQSRAEASDVSRCIKSRQKYDGRGFPKPYKCDRCEGWHIGRKIHRTKWAGVQRYYS